MTRFITGLLAALTFSFISVNAYSFDENPVEWVIPDIQTYYKTGNVTGQTPTETASNYWASNYSSYALSLNATYQDLKNTGVDDMGMSSSKYKFYGKYSYCFPPDSNGNKSCGTGGTFIYVTKVPDAKVCPPSIAPDYIRGPMTAPDGSKDVCLPKFDKCALGYFANAVTPTNGEKQCVPISCPSSGTQSQVFNTNKLVTVGAQGTYCDGKCAYSISTDTGASYNGASFVTGTALGSICGQGSTSDAFFQDGFDDSKNCTENSLSSGGTYLTCDSTTTESGEADSTTGDLEQTQDDAFVDTTSSIEPFAEQDCTTSGSEITCVGTNITSAIEHQTEQQKKLDDEKHNKLVTMQKETTEYLAQQALDRESRELTQSAQETDMIVNALGGISTVITNQGTSSGDGDGGNSDLIESFDGDSLLGEADGILSDGETALDDAQSDLDNAVEDALTKFTPESGIWNPFKQIPDYIPPLAVCAPFELGLEPNTLSLDLCEYNEIIKKAIAFIFIILTAMRLFYQSQRIIRNVALAQG